MRFFILTSMLFLLKPNISAQHDYIIFGKGGGISGEISAYKIMENGTVYEGWGRLEIKYSTKAKIKKAKARKLIKEVNNIGVPAFNRPGNIYYFITYGFNENEVKYTWGSADFEVPQELILLFRKTFEMLSKLEYMPAASE